MISHQVRAFVQLGPLPSELDDSEDGDEAFEARERALLAVEPPVSAEEADLLLGAFGEDDCFGLAWTLLHLVESAPAPAVSTAPPAGSNPWIIRLWQRHQNDKDPG
ncbi:hypothetical protein Ari01nite_56250 [Paractinoplanes rishiriensis]|uniref:Uncharacterized protein n=2 Tax=Paractinoplanes rishiriensis TaxID=1050105 RepID=A0A919K074_9ACTN|nr:hypothetical protein Ari01nite_56250 [Actinoplanes rishiriensis]